MSGRGRFDGVFGMLGLTLALGGCAARASRGGGVQPDGASPGDAPVTGEVTALPVAQATCAEAAPLLAAANTARVTLPLSIVIGGQSLVLDQLMDSAPGRTHKITVLQFFLAAPLLRDGQGRWIEAQFLDDAGAPRPYGVLLVDSDKGLNARLVLAAPAGAYTALALGLGLPAACNALNPTRNVYPLTVETGLYWGVGLNYLFFRVEGQEVVNGSNLGLMHHTGFDATYKTVVLGGAISVGADALGPTLVFDLGRALDGFMTTPPPDAGLGDSWFADQLAVPGVFSLRP